MNGSKAEAKAEQRPPPERRPEQGSATRSNEFPGSSRSAEKDEEDDPAADTCAQQEVREKLEAAIAAATETVELGSEACDSQVCACCLMSAKETFCCTLTSGLKPSVL